MGFYFVPFHQPNLPTQFLLITGHWNVPLPSGALLWNGMFAQVEGQNTTQSVMIMAWTGAHCMFAVEIYFKTGKSVNAIQRAFCTLFMLCQNDAVLDRKLILLWIENFRFQFLCLMVFQPF